MIMQNPPVDSYGFSAEPKVIKPKTKYREVPQDQLEEPERNYANLMWDKRVARGNTYAAIVTTSREAAQQMKSTLSKPKRIIQNTTETGEGDVVGGEVNTPRAIDGRRHVELQTDENVEVLTDKPPVYEKDCQTEFVIEKPVPRHYMPVKTGEDRETQIWDGELFHFDYEVEPILQVLIGKALEHGRMEVLEEEELRTMREEQKRYDELRLAEMMEAQRLEAKERKLMEENERRKKEHRLKKESMISSHKKLVARVAAKEYLRDISRNAISELAGEGLFVDRLQIALNADLLPWLINETLGNLTETDNLEKMVDAVADDLFGNILDQHQKAVEAEMERRRIAKEEAERLEAEKAERKRIRQEERKRREEEKRREKLQEQIMETLMAKAETRERAFAQAISDIDSYGKDGNTVGLFGGLVGELLVLLSTIESLKEEEEFVHFRTMEINETVIDDLINRLFAEVIEGVVELGVGPEVEAQITAIDETLNLETLYANPDKIPELQNVIRPAIKSYILTFIKKNMETLSLKPDFLEWILDSIVKLVFTQDETLRKVKLVMSTVSYKKKEPKHVAIASFQPSPEGARPYAFPERKQEEKKDNKSSTTKISRDPSKASLSQKSGNKIVDAADSATEEEDLDPAEIDYEDKVTVFPLVNEEIRVFVSHRSAAITLRRNIILMLSETFTELQSKELDVLKRVNNKANSIEEFFAKTLGENFPILPFDMQ